jgi:hypothetical protein
MLARLIKKPFPDRITLHLTPDFLEEQAKRPIVIFLP